MAGDLPGELAGTKSLERRARRMSETRVARFGPHRAFLVALFRIAADPANPLSPFGAETKPIRDASVAWFRRAGDWASESLPKDITPFLPMLFWLSHMGVIAFWVSDQAPPQRR